MKLSLRLKKALHQLSKLSDFHPDNCRDTNKCPICIAIKEVQGVKTVLETVEQKEEQKEERKGGII